MTVYLVISLPEIPYIYTVYIYVHIWFWPILHMTESASMSTSIHHIQGWTEPYIYIYGVYTVFEGIFWEGKSPNIRSYTVNTYTRFWPTLIISDMTSSTHTHRHTGSYTHPAPRTHVNTHVHVT